MGGQDRKTDLILSAIASGQFGVVTLRQALASAVTARQVEKRLGKGSLIGVYSGVYRVGHVAPSIEADYMAAVLACGKGAALCGRAAAHLQGLIRGHHPEPEVITRTERRIPGIATRRVRRLHTADVGEWRGIPVTTPARTLVDLASALSSDELARAVHEATVRHGSCGTTRSSC